MWRSNNGPAMFDSNETSLSNIKRYINFVIIRIDQLILDTTCPYLNYLSSKGELSGFKLAYKLPRAQKGNAQLDREVLANGDYLFLGQNKIDQITFKHKKVFPVNLDSELIRKWDSSVLEFILTAVTASPKLPTDCKVAKHVARVSVPLCELLSPPFRISRDCTMLGGDFRGRLAFSIELGSRNVRVAELLADMRKTQLDDTYTVNERRTRSRSSSRCHSHNDGNYALPEDVIYAPKVPQTRSRTQSSYSISHNDENYAPTENISYTPKVPQTRSRPQSSYPISPVALCAKLQNDVDKLLAEMKKTQVDDTANERELTGGTRSRSSSRCHSHNDENYALIEDISYAPKAPQIHSQPQSSYSISPAALCAKLQNDVDELVNAVNNLGR